MPPTSAKAAKADSEDPDAWRKDKYGKLLTANALYLRFFRQCRSPKENALPEEIREEACAAQGEQGKSKMHELYNACLSCKGDWCRSTLLVSVRKLHRLKTSEVWQWFTRCAREPSGFCRLSRRFDRAAQRSGEEAGRQGALDPD